MWPSSESSPRRGLIPKADGDDADVICSVQPQGLLHLQGGDPQSECNCCISSHHSWPDQQFAACSALGTAASPSITGLHLGTFPLRQQNSAPSRPPPNLVSPASGRIAGGHCALADAVEQTQWLVGWAARPTGRHMLAARGANSAI